MELTGPRLPRPEEPPSGEELGKWPTQPVSPGDYWWPGPPAQQEQHSGLVRHGQLGPNAPQWGTSTGDAWRPERPAPGPRGEPRPGRSQAGRFRGAWRRVIAAALAVGGFLAKFGALLLKLKYLTLVLSMFVSVLAYTLLWGWSFAVGFVAMLFVHEMGHVIELRRQGIRASLPMFIPFLGAFVNMRQMPRTAYQEALSGLAGPYFGTAAAIVVASWGHAIGSNFLLQLAGVGFLINLFNLLPMLPLDGGRAVAALHPAIWFAGLVGLLAFAIYFEAPIAFLVLVLGSFELWRRWTRRNSPSSIAYHALSAQQRLTIGALYVLVVAVAVAGFQLAYVARSLH